MAETSTRGHPRRPATRPVLLRTGLLFVLGLTLVSAGWARENSAARDARSDIPGPEVVSGLTRQPLKVASAGRRLGELQRQLEASLGVRLQFSGNAAETAVQGEISGTDGADFVRELASRLDLEWALGPEAVFLGTRGSARQTVFVAPSETVAATAARRASREFETRGSDLRAVAQRQELIVTGPPAWLSQVAAVRIPALIDDILGSQTQAQAAPAALAAVPASTSAGASPHRDDPLVLMIFRLNNAYVDDKRLSVGSSSLIIPGVARLFRQFTGLGDGASDSVRPTLAIGSDSLFGRADRLERLDSLAGGTLQRAYGDPVDGYYRGRERQEAPSGFAAEQPGQAPPADRGEMQANRPAAIADSRMNALIIRDYSSRMETNRALIRSLDQPVDMVQLDAYVIDIKTSKLDEFGIGLSWAGSKTLNSPGINPGDVALATGANVILQGMRGARVLAQIRALERTGDSELLTVPSVVTLNNLEATFSARENFYVKVAGNQDTSLNKVTAETLLKVTPLVSQVPGAPADRRIRLLISVQDGSVGDEATKLVDALPRTLENQISTQAVVRGGDTLIIGGQVVRKRTKNIAGLPFIRNLPILGPLTNSHSNETEQFVRIYVVRPRILGEDSELVQATTAAQGGDPSLNPALEKIPGMLQGASIAPVPTATATPRAVVNPEPEVLVVPIPQPGADASSRGSVAPALPLPQALPVQPAQADVPATAAGRTP